MAKSTDYADYWNELDDFEASRTSHNVSEESLEEEESKTPDFDKELTWLKQVGLSDLAALIEGGVDLEEDQFSEECQTLTRSQRAAVSKRVSRATLRRKSQSQDSHVKDVRDVFNENAPPNTRRHSEISANKSSSFRRTNYDMSGNTDETLLNVSRGLGIATLGMSSFPTIIRQRSMSVDDSRASIISDADILLNFDMKKSDAKLQFGELSNEDNLPNFTLISDKLGVTTVDDLSPDDLTRVRALALIELSSLFDIYNITYSKRKVKKNKKETGVFGVSLPVLLENDRKILSITNRVPLIFRNLIGGILEKGLEEEGILRVPGSLSRIKIFHQELEEQFYSGKFAWENIRANDLAALLKQFLRDLPYPLLSAELVDAFSQVEVISERKQQLQALNLLILLLPDHYRNCLQLLLQCLQTIVSHKDSNKMSLSNIAMIMSPNLFLPRSKGVPSKREKELEVLVAAKTNVVKLLVHYQGIIWTVPSLMITQIRHQHEQAQLKKDKSMEQDEVITIEASDFGKVSSTMKLDDQVTAGDIVARFRKKTPKAYNRETLTGRPVKEGCYNPSNVLFARDDTYLYEVGGNIGERCLSHNTNMRAVCTENPRARWIIKNKDI